MGMEGHLCVTLVQRRVETLASWLRALFGNGESKRAGVREHVLFVESHLQPLHDGWSFLSAKLGDLAALYLFCFFFFSNCCNR